MTEPKPHIEWDHGSGYDLFISLMALHAPDQFGLRASWAAGVRSRLRAEDRQTLEAAHTFLRVPVRWLQSLSGQKDASSILRALAQVPPRERLERLAGSAGVPNEALPLITQIATRGSWAQEDLEALREIFRRSDHELPRAKILTTMLDTWSRPEQFGQAYLAALEAYYQAFFFEEEKRISSALDAALQSARRLSREVSFEELFETLSHGVHAGPLLKKEVLVLVPSYWLTPFIIPVELDEQRTFVLFGARPAEESLIPGESVPDTLVRGLKALADPTRLRILRYLAHEQLTPSDLARRLRLRPPTVIHHLNALRLAGLVHLTLTEQEDRGYTARLAAANSLFEHLQEFIQDAGEDEVTARDTGDCA